MMKDTAAEGVQVMAGLAGLDRKSKITRGQRALQHFRANGALCCPNGGSARFGGRVGAPKTHPELQARDPPQPAPWEVNHQGCHCSGHLCGLGGLSSEEPENRERWQRLCCQHMVTTVWQ